MKGLFSRIFGRQQQEGNTSPHEPITVVSGLPRSGTSLMMRMLEAGGIPVVVDNLRTADTDNPNGYYELERVKKLPEGDTAWLEDAPGKVIKIISFLLTSLPETYQYRVVFMERALPEVLASQQKMLTHRQEATDDMSDDEATQLFTAHLQQTKDWLNNQPHMSVCFADYGEMVKNPTAGVTKINEFCGGQLDAGSMLAVVDPALYRNRG